MPQPGPLGWLSVLLPHLADERFVLPEEALVEYHRLSWEY